MCFCQIGIRAPPPLPSIWYQSITLSNWYQSPGALSVSPPSPCASLSFEGEAICCSSVHKEAKEPLLSGGAASTAAQKTWRCSEEELFVCACGGETLQPCVQASCLIVVLRVEPSGGAFGEYLRGVHVLVPVCMKKSRASGCRREGVK